MIDPSAAESIAKLKQWAVRGYGKPVKVHIDSTVEDSSVRHELSFTAAPGKPSE